MMHFRTLLVCVLLASMTSAAAQDGRVLTGASFYENFSTLDRSRWFISNGWSNGPHQNCTWSAANVRRSQNALLLTLNHRRGVDRPYSCAELQTQSLYRFGTFEARFRPAAGAGIVTAFFVYSQPPKGAAAVPEQITFNFLGKDHSVVHLTHSAGKLDVQRRNVQLTFEPSTTTADYAFQWTPTLLRWYVNREVIHEVKLGPNAAFPNAPAKLYLSIRNGIGESEEAWLGHFQYGHQPLVTTFEYVAFTELGAPCQFPSSVVCGDRR